MKHKKMRGVVAMLLTLVMVVGMLPTSVYADDAGEGNTSVVSTVVEQTADTPSAEDADALPTGESADDKGTDVAGTGNSVGDAETPSTENGGKADAKDVAGDAKTNVGTEAEQKPDMSEKPDKAETSSSSDEVKNGEPAEAKKEESKEAGEDPSAEDGLRDPYAGEETPVSVSVLYGSAQNAPRAISAMRAPARSSGTITTGDDMSYNSKWMAEFAPYSSAVVKYFNGQPAYCIEPHKNAPGSGTSVDASSYWENNRVRLALAYGYGGVDDSTLLWYAGNGTYAWCATQEVIWEIVGGYSDLSDLFVGPGHSYDASVAEPIKAAHDYIWEKINQQSTIPSFAVAYPYNTSKDIELTWDGSSWTATRTDTNSVLRNFRRFKFSLPGVSTSQSGNTLTITATPEAAKSMLNGIVSRPSEGNTINPDSINAYLLVAGGGN